MMVEKTDSTLTLKITLNDKNSIYIPAEPKMNDMPSYSIQPFEEGGIVGVSIDGNYIRSSFSKQQCDISTIAMKFSNKCFLTFLPLNFQQGLDRGSAKSEFSINLINFKKFYMFENLFVWQVLKKCGFEILTLILIFFIRHSCTQYCVIQHSWSFSAPVPDEKYTRICEIYIALFLQNSLSFGFRVIFLTSVSRE